MKHRYPDVGLARISRLFGISRQAHYKYQKKKEKILIEDHILIQMVSELRKDHPRMGTRKIYYLIKEDMDRLGIKMGRDGLFDLLASRGMLVQKRKRSRHITTNSRHWYRKYPNLIKGITPDGPNQIWVSDITYIKIKNKFSYIFLITDVYSKKIVGYRLAKTLDSVHAVNSLQDAIRNSSQPISGLIHHSDRGIQYCSKEYISLLNRYSIGISMTEHGDPLENSVAERINGILKEEYLREEITKNNVLTDNQLARVIEKYNSKRPHLSCNMMTPDQAHLKSGQLRRLWKNYYRKTVNLDV